MPRSHALRLGDDRDGTPYEPDHYLRQFADGNILAGAQIEDAPHGLVRFGPRQESGNDVSYKRKVAPGGQVSQFHHIGCQGLGDNRGDDGPGRLAWPIGIERPNCGHRQRETATEALNQLICANLASGIG